VAQDQSRPADVETLAAAVLEGAGETTSELRQRLAAGMEVPAELELYADTVRRHAYKVTQEDLEDLRKCGYTENAIFEITLSVALGAALLRLDAGLGALRGDRF
jgi:alkylhydroperoxidase family enzyme